MKPVHWMGSSLKDIRAMPSDVQDAFGHALYFAQIGDKHAGAKPLKGFRGAGVLEIVENHDGDTYRAVDTVRSVHAVYVSTCSRRNRSEALQLRRPILTSYGND